MPKVTNTRAQRAKDLLNMLKNGPSFSVMDFNGVTHPYKMAEQAYRRWAESWILPELEELVPELYAQQPITTQEATIYARSLHPWATVTNTENGQMWLALEFLEDPPSEARGPCYAIRSPRKEAREDIFKLIKAFKEKNGS